MSLSRLLLGSMVLSLVLAGFVSADEEHVVHAGETAYGIAHQYGIPVASLLSANHILRPRDLRVGAVLKIPSIYVVRRGDTLYGIARSYKIPLADLLSLNHIGATHLLTVGERLIVPGPSRADQPDGGARAGGAVVSGGGSGSAPGSAGATSEAGGGSASTGSATIAESAAVPDSDGTPFWPHPGRRVFLTGKLAGGTQIWGRVGDPIFSVSTGRVVWVGPYRGYGRVVFVQSPESYIYVYGGGERTLVRVGEQVSPGTEVAEMGLNPRVGRASTYFFVYRDGKPVDPATAPRG